MAKFNFVHYVIDLGRPQQNGKVKAVVYPDIVKSSSKILPQKQ